MKKKIASTEFPYYNLGRGGESLHLQAILSSLAPPL